MTDTNGRTLSTILHDLTAGLVIFLVALPLCLGIALASNAPLFSGVVAGIVGGIVVGALSGSHTSVAGPAAGLTAVVAAQIAALGSFRAFLLAVLFAGVLQVALGIARAGFIAAFVPSSVIKGLMAAIGVILILKQIPHLLGHDADPEGDLAFRQADQETTFSEIATMVDRIHPGAAVIGFASLALLVLWDRFESLRRTVFPAPLLVVLLGAGGALAFQRLGAPWALAPNNFVQVPVADGPSAFFGFLQPPDFSQWSNPAVYTAAMTLAIVASLETLLNLKAVDKLDPLQRKSPPSRELVAQGVGNIASALAGGLPVTSVIIRSAVNVNAGGRTKLATITHGVLLLVSVMFLSPWLNRIPLSCLAAILLVTGIKLVSPKLVKQAWKQGRHQFVPFVVTVVAIVVTDLLTGVLCGLAMSVAFILHSSLRRPIRRVVEKQLGRTVLHVELANQVSFLNRAALTRVLDEVPSGGHVLLDARSTDYIDPDVLDLLREFREETGPARGVEVSLVGFRDEYDLRDELHYVDHSTRELQSATTPQQVLQILKDGHERFRTGRRLTRDLGRQVGATAGGQHPLAVVLSCIDSRAPAELIFDLGVGDVFSVRVAGNITSRKVLGSIEYACAVAGAKLILVLGHTRCGAVTAAVDFAGSTRTASEATGCQHLDYIVNEIQRSTDPRACEGIHELPSPEREAFIDAVARRNVVRVVETILQQSQTLAQLSREGRIAIVPAMYDVATGRIEFLEHDGASPALDHAAWPAL